MLRNSNFCLPSVPFQTAWLAALLYRCFSLRKRSSKGHFGLMAGMVCHKFAGKTGQLIARAARLIEMANLLTVSRFASKIVIVLALAVAITMPSIRRPGPPARNCRIVWRPEIKDTRWLRHQPRSQERLPAAPLHHRRGTLQLR